MTIDTDPLALKRDVDRSVQQWLDREAARAAAATKAAAPQAAAAPASGPAGAMSAAAPTSEQTARRARMAAFLSIIANEGPSGHSRGRRSPNSIGSTQRKSAPSKRPRSRPGR